MSRNSSIVKHRIRTRDMVIFAMLGTLMFCSKIAMETLPNVHLLGMLTMVYTIVYRYRALIPVYIYVILVGAVPLYLDDPVGNYHAFAEADAEECGGGGVSPDLRDPRLRLWYSVRTGAGPYVRP